MLSSMFQLMISISTREHSKWPTTMLEFMFLLGRLFLTVYNEFIDDIQW